VFLFLLYPAENVLSVHVELGFSRDDFDIEIDSRSEKVSVRGAA
jgi:hypothetical protein